MKLLQILLIVVLIVAGLTLVYGLSPIHPVRELFTYTTIDAPRQQVWQVLTNFGAYQQWNPFYTEVDGKCIPGEHLHVRMQMEERSVTYAPVVQSVTPQSEMVWSEHLIFPGLLDGQHRFLLESNDSGQTRFVQHDTYSGALVPILMDLYQAQAENGFRRMNDALKKRVEQELAVGTTEQQ
jgi:hypothetical protein